MKTNSAKLKNVSTNKEYKCIRMLELFPPYYEDRWECKKGLFSYQYRMYKTWKYNRKTQYKVL